MARPSTTVKPKPRNHESDGGLVCAPWLCVASMASHNHEGYDQSCAYIHDKNSSPANRPRRLRYVR